MKTLIFENLVLIRKYWIILFGLGTILLSHFLPYNSVLVETFYSKGLFQIFRLIHDYTFGLIPIPPIYVLLVCLISGLIIYIRGLKKRMNNISWVQRILKIFKDILLFITVVLSLFYWLWGFNYHRISFAKKNNLSKIEIQEDWLFEQLDSVHATLRHLRAGLEYSYDHKMYEKEIRKVMKSQLLNLGYENNGRVRVRSISPKGNLLVWSTAGVYLPFVSEGHIDAGLPNLVKPFTLAHEMMHGYGEGGESECNFIAFLICINSENPKIQYSGWLGYFRYLLSSCRRTNVERYDDFKSQILDQDVRNDINSIYQQLQKYPDILPKLRYLFYDQYLKSHGVKEGMLSYSMMIRLAAMWEEKHGNFTLNR